jgi:hypothetical protein
MTVENRVYLVYAPTGSESRSRAEEIDWRTNGEYATL